MKEPIGNRVGAYRRKIPLVRAAILFALFLALVTAVAVVLTRRLNTDVFGYLFAYVTSWCLVVACLWLTPLIWKVTLFEAEPLVGMQEFKEHVLRLAGEGHPFTRLLYER